MSTLFRDNSDIKHDCHYDKWSLHESDTPNKGSQCSYLKPPNTDWFGRIISMDSAITWVVCL